MMPVHNEKMYFLSLENHTFKSDIHLSPLTMGTITIIVCLEHVHLEKPKEENNLEFQIKPMYSRELPTEKKAFKKAQIYFLCCSSTVML